MVEVGFNWKNFEKGTLGKMGKEIDDVEEGEISDSGSDSVEEISEEDFRKKDVRILNERNSKQDSNSRDCPVRDLCKKYPSIYRGYPASSGLYSLAWASAVRNKPLNEIFKLGAEKDDNSTGSSRASSVASFVASVNIKEDKNRCGNSVKEMSNDMDVNGEREEGELEEGEIDLDSEPVEMEVEEVKDKGLSSRNDNVCDSEVDLEKKVNSFRGILEGITVAEAEKSMEEVCSRLQNALEMLRELVLENNVSRNDSLNKLAFEAVNCVFVSMKRNLKEQNNEILLRLFSVLKRNDPPLFSHSQLKEIEVMLLSLDSSGRASDQEKDIKVIDEMHKRVSNALVENDGCDLTSTNKLPLSAESLAHNKPNTLLQTSKLVISSFRNRASLLPLLDLHKDHDADSLPSPTQERTLALPILKPLNVGDMMIKPGSFQSKAANVAEKTRLHPYETDAFKAFSSYQQKFGLRSLFSTDRLPSPTPSEESGDAGGDIGGEVSSSAKIGDFKLNPPASGQPIVSSPLHTDAISSGMQVVAASITAAPVISGSNPAVKVSAKSRDPRLRFANSDVGALDLNQRSSQNTPKVEPVGGKMSSRKKKSIEEPILDSPALKRQRNEVESCGVVRDFYTVSGTGGWLEETDVGYQVTNTDQRVENADPNFRRMDDRVTCSVTVSPNSNVAVGGNEQVQLPVTSTGTPATLPLLLKDLAVNPTMLINLLLEQQQRLASESHSKSTRPVTSSHPSSTNSILAVAPIVNAASSDPSGNLPKSAGTLQDDSEKIRMKPRDPRRVLHGITLQKSVSSGPEQFRTNGPPTSNTQGSKESLISQKLEGHVESKPMQSLSIPQPDIAQQFTDNLKNIADIMSVSRALTSPMSQPLLSQPMQIKSDRVDMKPVVASSSEDQQTMTVSAPAVIATGPQPQNTWVDVAHLFEGYDDQQKAAIQRERARRIEEQKKMFSARKLCLVLDLDHTLLNSAKFVEVEPVHEEILRKKEELDREKPQRHLFRFPHMGMWTKLRPGIWNFLEKASKLFELHLYTMGNRVYATEMAKVLDPKGTLFAGRVMSRGDDGDLIDGDEKVPKSKDLEGVLGMESAVVIIDDSVRVWPHHKLNLIVVERYTYFPCSRRQFGLPGPSLLEIDHDERTEDGTLASSLAVIERIHQQFFSHHNLDDVDVRNILANEQQKILSGCRIVFSRIFPVGEANPHLHPLWQTAEQFGAVCTTQIDEQVTHVVANSLGTDKVNWARSKGRFVVHPGWVEASTLLYRRAHEQDFAIK
ncbi:hypothetical protein SLEP1_g9500 [Rubroshorea leprosula]|uniref:protein-serine/threonine phosphatase n=1 Tax=Rubroshorea leprosula TaxID=152421 RepID=A0AAV5IF05_9ROSI|nr:hypothetical protein SLEP1_g9500 [Rubroshorea leprosula]